MKKLKVVLLAIFILFCVSSITHAFNKEIFYQDETYIIYYQGSKIWLEIGDSSNSSRSNSSVYTPNENMDSWRRTTQTNRGMFDADIFFKKLPFPFGLLLASDMVYINKIIYYEEEKASITFFNGSPDAFLIALLTKVKNL